MSFFSKVLGFFSNKDKQIMEQPEHEIKETPPDDLVTTEQQDQHKEDNLNNKGSP